MQVFNGSVFNADATEGMSLASHSKQVRYGPVGNGKVMMDLEVE